MKKVIVALCLMMFLVACGSSSSTSGKRVGIPKVDSPTGAVVGVPDDSKTEVSASSEEVKEPEQKSGKNAADALKEYKETASTETVPPSAKSGNFYPEITVKGEGRDALKEKTRALFQQSDLDVDAEADSDFGPRYADEGDLPGEYGSGRFDD